MSDIILKLIIGAIGLCVLSLIGMIIYIGFINIGISIIIILIAIISYYLGDCLIKRFD
jgi:hypothetical protein